MKKTQIFSTLKVFIEVEETREEVINLINNAIFSNVLFIELQDFNGLRFHININHIILIK